LLSNSADNLRTMLFCGLAVGDLNEAGSDVLDGLDEAGEEEVEELVSLISPAPGLNCCLLNDNRFTTSTSGLGLGDSSGGFLVASEIWTIAQ
jgi:hypothetical protein